MVNRLARGAVGGGTDQGVATVYQKHRSVRRRKPAVDLAGVRMQT